MENSVINEFPQIKAVLKGIPERGIIELKTVNWKDQVLHLEPSKDGVTGRLLGIANLSVRDREKVSYCPNGSSFLNIVDGFRFDLSKFDDRMNWAWVKESNLIAPSFDDAQNTPGCSFYVSNEELELQEEMDYEEKMFKALTYIHDDKDEELIARARLLGVDMTGESPKNAKKYLLSVVKESDGVDRILKLYTSSTVATTLVFFKALDREVIKNTNGIYMLGTMPLGADDDVVINFLQAPTNVAILDEIKKQINPELYGDSAPKGSKGSRAKTE